MSSLAVSNHSPNVGQVLFAGVATVLALPPALVFAAIGVSMAALLALASLAACLISQKSAQTLRRYAFATLGEGLAKAMGALLYFIPGTWFDPKAGNGQVPILLVPGYLHNSSAWHLFRRKLLSYDKKRLIFTVDLGACPFGKSISTTFLNKLTKRIQEIKKITGATQIKLVGHSMGGVVSSLYACTQAEKENPDIRVVSVVTLGSPLEGSPLAKFAPGECARELRKNSELLRNLSVKIDGCRDRIQFFHVGSEVDALVSCSSATRNGKTKDVMVLKNLGHVAMKYSPTVMRKVNELLSASNPG